MCFEKAEQTCVQEGREGLGEEGMGRSRLGPFQDTPAC